MLNTTVLAALGAPEIAIILVVVLLLFGGKKIPELMRGLGRGVKEFKEGKDGNDAENYDRDRSNSNNKPL
ncbi:Sec-independent protein translocase subunit TatA/TatB [Pedobacter nutrimenti]|jgi:sec-independent protein translocase protein TatA|uniref:Sec-independent protein translocase protein TatA n=1 Tax=Pedobacter nutrimenti TaxID=1241337 RepID=A0A318UAS0_9SPHI|nr:twin-arginine translocase TatA/TatE family subunit [Pedobacter nutrimenti]PYF70112.1 sec-independent protein translocase protein TatA [Pedobacter nutrimenti]